MYEIDRIICPVQGIVHTDLMYKMDPYMAKIISLQNEHSPRPEHSTETFDATDEEQGRLRERLECLDECTSHLLYLLKCPPPNFSSEPPKFLKAGATGLHSSSTPVADLGSAVEQQRIISLTVQANPDNPPLAALLSCYLLSTNGWPVSVCSYVHSSVVHMPDYLTTLMNKLSAAQQHRNSVVNLRIVWTNTCPDCVTFLGFNCTELYGEAMLLEKLLTMIPNAGLTSADEVLIRIDNGLLLGSDTEQSETLKWLENHPHFTALERELPDIIDCFLYVCLKRSKLSKHLPPRLGSWYKFCSGVPQLSLVDKVIK
ncbi:unnamed protein product [Calicophoron daubneyi]|uniref:AIMP2 thioredoxin-like domain-containing protein n=1 Tax=Calicophoron daubneyi TaxID=300641 RepID=A0AAV2T034_CALDB